MTTRRQGTVWVMVQFTGVGLTLLPLLWSLQVFLPAFFPLLLGGLLAWWTLLHNRPGNFRIHPSPHPNGLLVTTGPYGWIRHPMYTSVLLLLIGVSLLTRDGFSVIGACLTALALDRKARLEEAQLQQQFAAYADYSCETRRFLPELY